jgi:hypothetical protein
MRNRTLIIPIYDIMLIPYAGSKESIFWTLYRKQWVNIEELPFTFPGHCGNNVEVGLSFISDKGRSN